MNRKGFSLIEMLGCILLMGVVLCIGLYSARGTLATSLATLTNTSENEILNASRMYVLENGVDWVNMNNEEYTCLTVNELVDKGYFEYNDVSSYRDRYIKIDRNTSTKVIEKVDFVDVCE